MKYLYGISESYNGLYTPADILVDDYKTLDKELVDKDYKFISEDESGFEYEKDGDYKKIFRCLVEESEG